MNNSNVLRDEADVRMAWVNADTLYLKVQYGGGCKEHTFQLYVLNYFLKSNPPQAEVRLSHNSRFDHCEAYLTDTLRFNLSPLRMLYKQIYSSPKGIVLLNIYEPQATQVTSPHVNYSF
ncbi:MAG: hypothetical protein HYZ33_02960 [Ignavibacteriales bacterium]|nr:hypothetical protein [Ignavibacteriales bacterium]